VPKTIAGAASALSALLRGSAGSALLLVATVGLPGGSAHAASFPCAKAATPTEQAICADAQLSRLDEQLAEAYRAAAAVLGATLECQPGKPSETAVQPLRASQRAWIAERDRCGRDRACLRRHYERRLAVLTFQPDPEAPEPVDRFVGRFTDGRQATAAILRLAPDRALILMSDIETSTARWICEFQGLGQIGADGRTLVASTPDLPGYELRMTARGLELEDLSGGDWCGVSGAIASPLQRQP
jgi:uncharacterized protein